jgi:hypothetical protein
MREDDGAVLRAHIRTLPVQRRRIVHAEKHLEQIVIADLLRIEGDLHDLCMSGRSGTHLLIRGVRARAARIAGDDALHAAQLAEERIDAPEASGAKGRDFAL